MRFSSRVLAWVAALLFVSAPALAAEYYVAPDGNDAAAGTEADPFATAQRGQQAASPGDTVYFRGGVYEFSGNSDIGVLFDKSGQDGARINYFAYAGETPVFDFNNLTPQARIRGFSVRASWLHFRGLELTGVQQILVDQNESWCIRVENGASNNIFEQLDLHHNEGPGLFIQDGGNNLVLNVDSHHNYDPDRGGENADGFGCHSDDAGNVFRGCRAWFNSDDGFDFINSPGVCTVESSWAFRSGFVPDSNTGAGNGAGIKAGGFTNNIPATIPRHVVRFNLSFGNRSQGFYANHHEGGIDWINNTAFNNPRNFDMLADEGRAEHYMKNNLAAGSGEALARATLDEIDDSVNSWTLGVSVSDADFASTSDSGVDGPRAADGSLPVVDFMRLVEGSDLIDAGQDEGLPFTGDAPDLGAFEFGASPQVPTDTGAGGAEGMDGGDEPSAGGTPGAGGDSGEATGEGGFAGDPPTPPSEPDGAPMSGAGGAAAGEPPAEQTPPQSPGGDVEPGQSEPMTPVSVPSPTGAPSGDLGTTDGTNTEGTSETPSVATASPSGTAASPSLAGDGRDDPGGCGCVVLGRGLPAGRRPAEGSFAAVMLGLALLRRRRSR